MMQVDAYLVELLTQSVPCEMLMEAWFLRECYVNELCY